MGVRIQIVQEAELEKLIDYSMIDQRLGVLGQL